MFEAALFCAASLLAVPAAPLRSADAEPERVKILPPEQKNRNPALARYFAEIDSVVSHMTKDQDDRGFVINVVVLDQALDGGAPMQIVGLNRQLRIYLSPGVSGKIAQDQEACRKIVSAVLLKNLKMNPDAVGEKAVPFWIAAGLSHKIKRRSLNDAFAGLNIYPGVNALSVSGRLPPVKAVIEQEEMRSEASGTELFGQVCEALCDSIAMDGAGREAFRSAVGMGVEGSSPYTAFSQAFLKMLSKCDMYKFALCDSDVAEDISEEQRLNLWFRYCMMRSSVNVFRPAPAAFVRDRFKAMQKVRYKFAGKEGDAPSVFRECSIDEIPSRIKEMGDRDYVVARQEKYLTELMYMSSSEMYPSIRALIESFSPLRRGNAAGFSGKYSEACALFEKDTARMASLEKFLDESQGELMTPGEVLAPLAKELDEHEGLVRGVWPALQALLDSQEGGKK